MTPRSTSVPARSSGLCHNRGSGALLASWVSAASLLVSFTPALFVGCGGQSNEPVGSTDTGNPPVIAETKLRVVASDDGVVVSGSKGAVSAGADISVTNLTTNKSADATASDDGSFSVAVEGSVGDAYRVEAELNGKRTQAQLPAGQAEANPDGHTFLLDTSEGYERVSDTSITLSFSDGDLRFNAGCNSHAGAYSLCDGKVCMSELSSTEIGCDAALHAQDEWLADFFTSTPSINYAPPRLTITGDGATLEFLDREEADPDRSLEGRLWTIDTFIDGDAASNFPLMNTPTIRFESDGTFVAFNTCNGMEGTYTVDDQQLTLADVISDERSCDTDLTAQEHFSEVISPGTVAFTIEARRLTLMRDDLGLSATTE